MTLKITITKRRPTAAGFLEEDIIRVENSEPLTTGQDILSLLELAMDAQPTSSTLNQKTNTEATKTIEAKKSEAKKAEPNKPTFLPPKPKSSEPIIEGDKKQVELIGSNSTGFSIGELIEEDPERRVKVYILCSECGHEATGGARLKDRWIKCKECQEKMYLEQTTDIYGEKDEDGYTYEATKRFFTAKEMYDFKSKGVTEQ